MQDLRAMHAQLCPTKCFGNFWKSTDYKAAHKVLIALDIPADKIRVVTPSSRSHPSSTLVHPMVALAFIRWTDPDLFYAKLGRIINQ